MKTCIKTSRGTRAPILRPSALENLSREDGAFTLLEALVSMILVMSLITVSIATLFRTDQSARRLADYTEAMIVVDANVQSIRNLTYNPPSGTYFKTNAVYVTNSITAISLDQTGTSNRVPCTVIAKIEPVASGHLVTVTGTFTERGRNLVVSLQTIVNKLSGGQQ